jgi:hypothetical protein
MNKEYGDESQFVFAGANRVLSEVRFGAGDESN